MNEPCRGRLRPLLFLVLLVSTLYPRLVLLGSLPAMDEGYYGWQAREMYEYLLQGRALPASALNLYPLLLCWVCALPGKTLLWLRAADLVVALASAGLFCKYILRKAGRTPLGLGIAFVFLCAMNMEAVINGGFKNSIAAAWMPIFAALLLCRKECPATSPRWFFMGVLLAVATLLREPFFLFALLGCAPVVFLGGARALLRYMAGGLCAASLITVPLCLAHEHFGDVFRTYFQAADVYAIQAGQVFHNFTANGGRALSLFICPIFLTLAGLVLSWRGEGSRLADACAAAARQTSPARGCQRTWLYENIFWLSAFLLPLLEPLLKIGFLYHFAVALPGLGIFCALRWSRVPCGLFTGRKYLLRLLLGAPAVASLFFLPSVARIGDSLENLAAMGEQAWPERQVGTSNTLLAARIIQQNEEKGGTLSSSGFTYFLYGASGFNPPLHGPFAAGDRHRLGDLSRSYRALGADPEKLAAALRLNPPDLLVIARATTNHEPDHHEELEKAVELTGLYRLLETVPPDAAKNYGWLEFKIFKKTGVSPQTGR